MSDNRVKFRSVCFSIPRAATRDMRLSIDARGLLALLMGMSSNWTFRREWLMKACGCKRHKYDGMITELKAAGYLSVEKIRNESGHFSGYEWTIIDASGQAESMKNRPSEKRKVGKPDHLRETNFKLPIKQAKKTDLPKRIYETWNIMAEAHGLQTVRLNMPSPERDKAILRRLAECEGQEILLFEVIRNVTHNPFWIGRGAKVWYIYFDWIFKSKSNFRKVLEFQKPEPENAKPNNYKSKGQQYSESNDAAVEAALQFAQSGVRL